MIEVTTIFQPTEVISIEINDWKKKKKKLLDLMDQTKMYIADDVLTSYDHRYESYHLREIFDILKEEFQAFSKHTKRTNFKASFWFQSYGPKQRHGIHHHFPGARYASTIFLNYDPEFHYPTQYIQRNPFSGSTETTFNPMTKEGCWYLWPAAVDHFTLPCDNPDAPHRTILSINLIFEND